MAQSVTLNPRRAKPKKSHAPTRAEMLDGRAAQVSAAEPGALDAPGIDELGAEQVDRVIRAAIAEVQAARAVWGRSRLIAAIDTQLPGGWGP